MYKHPPLDLLHMADVVEDTTAIANIMGAFTFLNCYKQHKRQFENWSHGSRRCTAGWPVDAGEASRGETGYIFSNQPFGGNYSTMAAQNGDENCNWWPVQDVAETSGQTIPFYEETSMVDTTGAAKISISSQCENVETALQFLDYGYSYEGGLLYNYGFEEGSGHDVETWYYDDNGEPMFDGDALLSVAESTNLASGVVATKDLAGVVYDTRLSFEFGERELSCFDAWSTNKNGSNNLGSDVVLTSEESTEASAIYSDIITHVATSALQFINGAQDVDDDAVWNSYVKSIEDMNIDGLTEIIQTAYDRAAGADDDAQLALFHLEIHAVQRMNSAIAAGIDPGYIFEFNICHLFSPSITAIYCFPHKL